MRRDTERSGWRKGNDRSSGSGGLLARQTFDGFVQRRIAGGRSLTEFDVRLVNGDGRRQALLVKRRARRREIPGRGQPEAAAVRQLDEALHRCPSDGVFADEIGALIARERG